MTTQMLAGWSDDLVYAATAVMALAFVAHAVEWAFARERRTRSAVGASARAENAASAEERGGGVAVVTRPHTSTPDPDAAERSATFARIGVALTILATLLLAGGVLFRGIAAERVPWSNLYEFATTGTVLVAALYLLGSKRFGLGWLALPLTFVLLAVLTTAITVLYTPVSGLIPALESYWLIIHVSAAVTATAGFTLGALASILQLLRSRAERRAIANHEPVGGYLGRLPSAEAIDRIAYRLHAFAFPVWTFALITGAIWAAAAWGRYWGWDPKETWMFITWVCYAAYLHARSTAGWRSRVSWIAIVAYLALLFNLIGVNFLVSGLHSYAGI